MDKQLKYKVQYADKERFGQWSEWSDDWNAFKGLIILTFILNEQLTLSEWNLFCKEQGL